MSEPIPLSLLIEKLNLTPLVPEGGMFALTQKSVQLTTAKNIHGNELEHPLSSAIYYLLTTDAASFSAFHRLPTDEVYHHYLGLPVTIYMIDQEGILKIVTIGSDIIAGQRPQVTIPAYTWQASHVVTQDDMVSDYALLGTTMSPGYIDEDFELGKRNQLIEMFPAHTGIIKQLTRS